MGKYSFMVMFDADDDADAKTRSDAWAKAVMDAGVEAECQLMDMVIGRVAFGRITPAPLDLVHRGMIADATVRRAGEEW